MTFWKEATLRKTLVGKLWFREWRLTSPSPSNPYRSLKIHTFWAFTRCLGIWCQLRWRLSKWVKTCVYPSIFKFLSVVQIPHPFTLQAFMRQVHALLQSAFSLVRPCASSSILQYLISAVSPSSCLRPFLHLLVPSIFPSIKCVRSQFVRKMWPTKLSVLRSIICRMFSSFLIFPHTFKYFQRHVVKYSVGKRPCARR